MFVSQKSKCQIPGKYLIHTFTTNGQGTGTRVSVEFCNLTRFDITMDRFVKVDIVQQVQPCDDYDLKIFVNTIYSDRCAKALNRTVHCYTSKAQFDMSESALMAAATICFQRYHAGDDYPHWCFKDRNPGPIWGGKSVKMISFETKSKKKITAHLDTNWRIFGGGVHLNFPIADSIPIADGSSWKCRDETRPFLCGLLDACLGRHVDYVQSVYYSEELKVVIVRIVGIVDCESNSVITDISPDFDRMLAVENVDLNGIIVTVASNSGRVDFYSRYFSPWLGVNDDPVTGSPHLVLTPFWSKYHPVKAGSKTFIGKYCSKRGGIVKCRLEGDRVILTGSTHIITDGVI